MILECGGLPVLAHPVQLRNENDAQLERIVKDLMDLGLAGIEVIHSDHDAQLIENTRRWPTDSDCSKPAAAISTAATRTDRSRHRQRPPHSAGVF